MDEASLHDLCLILRHSELVSESPHPQLMTTRHSELIAESLPLSRLLISHVQHVQHEYSHPETLK